MKPIGLVTCYFHHNYGSMLQAYATEMIFQKMNLPYQTISCKSPIVYMQGNKLLYIIKKILIADWKMRIGKIKIEYYKKKYPDSFGRNVDLRNACFDRFSQEYFHLSPYCKNREELKAMANNYSAFVVGSDQLWRTDSVEHGYYTLEWVPDNICKIAYSTSLGIKKVPWFQRKKNRWFMKRFNYMALREKSACDLVYKLIGREIQGLIPILFFLFSIAGITYGITTGSFKSVKDVNKAMVKQMSGMGAYVVFCFFCGQFQALFNWTHLGTLMAISGADFLRGIGFTGLPMCIAFILITALINIFVSSGSAKWAILAPIFVPMFMLLRHIW